MYLSLLQLPAKYLSHARQPYTLKVFNPPNWHATNARIFENIPCFSLLSNHVFGEISQIEYMSRIDAEKKDPESFYNTLSGAEYFNLNVAIVNYILGI